MEKEFSPAKQHKVSLSFDSRAVLRYIFGQTLAQHLIARQLPTWASIFGNPPSLLLDGGIMIATRRRSAGFSHSHRLFSSSQF